MFAYPSTFDFPSVCLSSCLSTCLLIHLCVHLFICRSICPSFCLSLSVCLLATRLLANIHSKCNGCSIHAVYTYHIYVNIYQKKSRILLPKSGIIYSMIHISHCLDISTCHLFDSPTAFAAKPTDSRQRSFGWTWIVVLFHDRSGPPPRPLPQGSLKPVALFCCV